MKPQKKHLRFLPDTIALRDKLLIFLTGFAITLLVFRMVKSHQSTYLFLLWNLFLAVIPLLISRFVSHHRIQPRLGKSFYACAVLWLLFLPNAPYILTDFIHLEAMDNIPLWFDSFLLTFFAWVGFMYGIVSVADMEKVVTFLHSPRVGKGFAVASLILSSLGVYMGRFLRYNSWDVFVKPAEIVFNVGNRIINPLTYPGLYGMIGILSVLLVCFYAFFRKVETLVPDNK